MKIHIYIFKWEPESFLRTNCYWDSFWRQMSNTKLDFGSDGYSFLLSSELRFNCHAILLVVSDQPACLVLICCTLCLDFNSCPLRVRSIVVHQSSLRVGCCVLLVVWCIVYCALILRFSEFLFTELRVGDSTLSSFCISKEIWLRHTFGLFLESLGACMHSNGLLSLSARCMDIRSFICSGFHSCVEYAK